MCNGLSRLKLNDIFTLGDNTRIRGMHCNLRSTDATPVLFRFNYHAMPSVNSLNLSIILVRCFNLKCVYLYMYVYSFRPTQPTIPPGG